MITQVVFKVDPKLKSKAMKKAEAEGINLSTVLKFATQAFVDGKLEVGLKFNAKTSKDLDRIFKDAEEDKNLTPAFKSGAEIRKYVRGNDR